MYTFMHKRIEDVGRFSNLLLNGRGSHWSTMNAIQWQSGQFSIPHVVNVFGLLTLPSANVEMYNLQNAARSVIRFVCMLISEDWSALISTQSSQIEPPAAKRLQGLCCQINSMRNWCVGLNPSFQRHLQCSTVSVRLIS
jgi:hypothetical protein